MTDQVKPNVSDPDKASSASETLDEYAELEQAIRRRLRSNQRFLERFLDEDFDDEEDIPEDEDGPAGQEDQEEL